MGQGRDRRLDAIEDRVERLGATLGGPTATDVQRVGAAERRVADYVREDIRAQVFGTERPGLDERQHAEDLALLQRWNEEHRIEPFDRAVFVAMLEALAERQRHPPSENPSDLGSPSAEVEEE